MRTYPLLGFCVLLTLAAACGTSVRLTVEGEDEDQALAALSGLVRDRFGEST